LIQVADEANAKEGEREEGWSLNKIEWLVPLTHLPSQWVNMGSYKYGGRGKATGWFDSSTVLVPQFHRSTLHGWGDDD